MPPLGKPFERPRLSQFGDRCPAWHFGYAYSQSGDNAKALEDYRKVLELKPGDADAQTRVKAVESRKPNGSLAPANSTPATK